MASHGLACYGCGWSGRVAGCSGNYNWAAVFRVEWVETLLFVVGLLGENGRGGPAARAGLAIGITLVGIHLVGRKVTGVSVNPARSIGPALFAGGHAISQLWLFIVAPVLGAVAAGFLFKAGLLDQAE